MWQLLLLLAANSDDRLQTLPLPGFELVNSLPSTLSTLDEGLNVGATLLKYFLVPVSLCRPLENDMDRHCLRLDITVTIVGIASQYTHDFSPTSWPANITRDQNFNRLKRASSECQGEDNARPIL